MNFHKNASKQQKDSLAVCGSLCGENQFFFNNYPILLVCSNTIVKTNPNFPQDFPLSNMVRKNKLSEYFSARFLDSHFYV